MYQGLIEQNNKIKAEADLILNDKGLLELLKKYGTPVVHGSYKHNLMTWRDLDIRLVSDDITKERFFELGVGLCKMFDPAAMHFKDWNQKNGAFSVEGYYWGVILGDERNGAWKIDIAAVTSAEQKRTAQIAEEMMSKLTDETREIIMEIKSVCWQDPQYRKKYGSWDIYTAVLDEGIKDLESFQEYLRNKEVL